MRVKQKVERSPTDGRLVGIAYATSAGDTPGDPEVVVLDPDRLPDVEAIDWRTFGDLGALEEGAVTVLTSGAWVEEVPIASGDGTRVVFNRRLDDFPREYDVRTLRQVVCWADIPER